MNYLALNTLHRVAFMKECLMAEHLSECTCWAVQRGQDKVMGSEARKLNLQREECLDLKEGNFTPMSSQDTTRCQM